MVSEGSGNGAKVGFVSQSPENSRWVLHKWPSGGWAFHNAENPENCLSFNHQGNIQSIIRRHNAGGKGDKDQMWQLAEVSQVP